MFIQTDISRDVHRKFFLFLLRITTFAEKTDEYIYIVRGMRERISSCNKFLMITPLPFGFQHVQAQLIVCTLGGINVPCPTKQNIIILIRCQAVLSIVLFEVVSDHRRKILSISYLHPGTRNYNHLVKFDAVASNLHDRNSFLGRQEGNVLTASLTVDCFIHYM